jgi:hypothetical protein
MRKSKCDVSANVIDPGIFKTAAANAIGIGFDIAAVFRFPISTATTIPIMRFKPL